MRRAVRRRVCRRSASVAKALEQIGVGVDAAIAKERPYPPHRFAALHVDVGDQEFAPVGFGLRKNFTLRPGNETRSPELQAAIAGAWRGFEAEAVAGEHGQAVCNGVAALHGTPGIALARFFV